MRHRALRHVLQRDAGAGRDETQLRLARHSAVTGYLITGEGQGQFRGEANESRPCDLYRGVITVYDCSCINIFYNA